MGHEEDLERRFEQALARHLRENAGACDGEPDPAGACPAGEVLAAVHERMLASEEMNAVKEHVAACSRCQEVLALLETTDVIELQAEEEKVLEMREPLLAIAAVHKEQFARAAAPASVESMTTALKTPQSISSGRGGKLLRWVAPAGAIAAGLLIWAVVRDSRPQNLAPAANVQVAQERDDEQGAQQARDATNNLRSDAADQSSRAENRQSSKSEKLSAPNSRAERQSQVTDRLSKDAGSAGGITAGSVAGRLATEDQSRTNKNLRATQPPAPPKIMLRRGPAVGTSTAPVAGAGTRASETKQATNLPMTARNEVVLSAEADAAKKAPARERDIQSKEKLEPGAAEASPAPSAPPAPMSENVVAQNATGTPLKPEQKRDADSKVNTEAVTTAQAEVSASYARTSASLKSKVADDSKIIVTPGGTALWRLRAAGIIERSEDRGLTWARQESGTTRELVNGSAPSDVVCWIVGRTGLILRTTDGGGHWEKVAAPLAGDLAGIRATDALHVTLLDSAGRTKFVTSDGGVNWQRVKE